MTPTTFGPESSTPFAFYDPDLSCWRTSATTLPWGSDKFSVTWPKWGSMRSGRAYAAPRSGHHTAANVSSLLPTPAAHEPGGTLEQYHERLRKADGREPGFVPLPMLVQLLPTPRASDGPERSSHGRTWSGTDFNLHNAVQLLPTPMANEKRNRTSARQPGSTHHDGVTLTDLFGDRTNPPCAGGSDSTDPPPDPGTNGDG